MVLQFAPGLHQLLAIEFHQCLDYHTHYATVITAWRRHALAGSAADIGKYHRIFGISGQTLTHGPAESIRRGPGNSNPLQGEAVRAADGESGSRVEAHDAKTPPTRGVSAGMKLPWGVLEGSACVCAAACCFIPPVGCSTHRRTAQLRVSTMGPGVPSLLHGREYFSIYVERWGLPARG